MVLQNNSLKLIINPINSSSQDQDITEETELNEEFIDPIGAQMHIHLLEQKGSFLQESSHQQSYTSSDLSVDFEESQAMNEAMNAGFKKNMTPPTLQMKKKDPSITQGSDTNIRDLEIQRRLVELRDTQIKDLEEKKKVQDEKINTLELAVGSYKSKELEIAKYKRTITALEEQVKELNKEKIELDRLYKGYFKKYEKWKKQAVRLDLQLNGKKHGQGPPPGGVGSSGGI